MIYNRIFDFRANYSSRKAFTLAETLITIGLIGILAAILIPALTAVSPNRNKVMLRKAYTTLEQTVSKMINDGVDYPSGQVVTDSNGHVCQRGFNYTDITTNTSNKFCYFFTDNLNTIGNISCPAVGAGWATTEKAADTTDGMTWFLNNSMSVENGWNFPVANAYDTFVIVDVNGVNNAPNCFNDQYWSTYKPDAATYNYTGTCSNPDTFIFGIRYDGKIQVGIGAGSDPYLENVLKNPTKNQ